GVPTPATAADVARGTVDIAGQDVRLDPVPPGRGHRVRGQHRVDEVEQLDRAPAPALKGRRAHDPGRGVRVLPAVLADARDVALDVAGVQVAAVERGREQQDEPVADQVFVHGLHRGGDP